MISGKIDTPLSLHIHRDCQPAAASVFVSDTLNALSILRWRLCCSCSSICVHVPLPTPSSSSYIPWDRCQSPVICHCLWYLGRVVYSSSFANAYAVVAEFLGPSYSADAAVVIVNTLILLTHRRLRRRRRSLGRIVSYTSSSDTPVVVVDTSGSSSSDYASVVVANSSGLSSRGRSFCRSFEASHSVKDYVPFGCWLHIFSGDALHLWLLGALLYPTFFGTTPLKTVEV